MSRPLACASSSFVQVWSDGSPSISSWYFLAALATMYCLAVSVRSVKSRQVLCLHRLFHTPILYV